MKICRKHSTFNGYCFIVLSKFVKINLKYFTVDYGKEFASYFELESELDLNVHFAVSL